MMTKHSFRKSFNRKLNSQPVYLLAILLVVWLLIPLFSNNQFQEASSSSLKQLVGEVDGASLSYLLTLDQPLFTDINQNNEQSVFKEFIFPLMTDLPYYDLRLLFGNELPNFPGVNNNILIAGSGTNIYTTSIESAPPEYIFEQEEEEQVPEEIETYNDQAVFIYNTHNREAFLPYMSEGTKPHEAFQSTDNVTDLSWMLSDLLKKRGIEAHVDQTDFYYQLQQGGLAYHQSYDVSRSVLKEVVSEENDSYLIDIHRDAQPGHITTTEIDGEKVAKLMFVVGGEHEGYEENTKIATELHKLLEEKYPEISRGVELKRGPSSNGVYNQDLGEKAMLLEVGGIDNTFEEMERSLEIFAEVFTEYYESDQEAAN
ncbi:stage II sporulation protein P [Halalkalibacillus halophilus]|uniref:stage II sporulation protein P n=1 Tax=Halalkalibacillus halophilus TaxID=392827 RepID=UPI00042A658D|nr:stage II sporulation protein P [Halalkalibacillus halophilus]